MLTDWVTIRRLAFELESRFRGARVDDVGLLPDGRIAITLRSHRLMRAIGIDAFGSPPLITVEEGDVSVAGTPGFIRSAAAALRGSTLLEVKSRRGDRLIRFAFGSRSKFGIGDTTELFVELVPRFGNVILVKNGSVIAAAKEFSLAQNGTRAVEAGMPYQPPPLINRPPLAPEIDPARFESDEFMHSPVFVYCKDDRVAQAYPAPLDQYAALELTSADSLLSVLTRLRDERSGIGARERTAARRTRLLKKLGERYEKIRGELESIASKRRKADDRERLRLAGSSIYESLHTIEDERAREDAKERAAALFAEYKKLGATIPHLDERRSTLVELQRAIDELRWETERADDDDLDDVAMAVAVLDPRAQRREIHTRRRKRPPLEFRTTEGSRILVGRSPSENAELTFKVARPNDLWFHAQNIPGAHVILQRDDREEPPGEDILRAATFAASFSKGKGSGKIPIDYTQRKYVRAARNAPPGLVWYTNARTILAKPE